MSRRKINFVQGSYYHLYNRGANRERIFQSDENYRFLLQRVKENVSEFQVSIIAYCLMPNHYHVAGHSPRGISSPLVGEIAPTILTPTVIR